MAKNLSKVAHLDRRRVLLASIAGSTVGLFSPALGVAAQVTQVAESAPVRVVNGFCAAVSKRDPAAVRPFFSDDIVYRMSETMPPLVGLEAVMGTFKTFVGDAESVEFRVLETFATGPIVVNRRIDRFALRQPLTVECVGVFYVKDDKIKEWSDYTVRMERG